MGPRRGRWWLPVSKHRKLGRILDQTGGWLDLQQDAQATRADEARALCGTHGPLIVSIREHVVALAFGRDAQMKSIVRAQGARWSRKHARYYLKLDQTEALAAIVQNAHALQASRESAAEERKDQMRQDALVTEASAILARDQAGAILDAVTGQGTSVFSVSGMSARVAVDGIHLRYPIHKGVNDRVRAMGGRFRGGVWIVPLSRADGVASIAVDLLSGRTELGNLFTESESTNGYTRACWECGMSYTSEQIRRRPGAVWSGDNPFMPDSCYCGC